LGYRLNAVSTAERFNCINRQTKLLGDISASFAASAKGCNFFFFTLVHSKHHPYHVMLALIVPISTTPVLIRAFIKQTPTEIMSG
jgi:hypothetical protein